MKYLVVIEKGESNLSAYVPDLPGLREYGRDFRRTDAQYSGMRNIQEAIEGHLVIMIEHGEIIPQPSSAAAEVELLAP
jgi:predicted RNase H-like HicB family nuclease